MIRDTPITIRELRARFPKPSAIRSKKWGPPATDIERYWRERRGEYCVGGALGKGLGTGENLEIAFPNRGELIEMIYLARLCNRADVVHPSWIKLWARQILRNNDSGAFEVAWSVLGHAIGDPELSYRFANLQELEGKEGT